MWRDEDRPRRLRAALRDTATLLIAAAAAGAIALAAVLETSS